MSCQVDIVLDRGGQTRTLIIEIDTRAWNVKCHLYGMMMDLYYLRKDFQTSLAVVGTALCDQWYFVTKQPQLIPVRASIDV